MKKHLVCALYIIISVFIICIYFGQTGYVEEETFKINPTVGTSVTLTISVPIKPINIQAISASKAALHIPDAYLKSAVHNCNSHNQWRSHVSEDYAKSLRITESNFEERRKLPRQIQKTGVILYWVVASREGTEMFYLVERVKYKHDLPEALAIRYFIRVNGIWVAHVRDELDLVGKMQISNLAALKANISKNG